MKVDRADGILSVDSGAVVATLAGSTMIVVAIVSAVLLLVAAAGGLFLFRRNGATDASTDGRPKDSPDDGDDHRSTGLTATNRRSDETSNETPKTTTEGTAAVTGPSFDERIGTHTLDRLEPIAATAVQDTRDRLPLGSDASTATLDNIERELRVGIEDAVDQGRLDPDVMSPIGGAYDVVNLPGQFREQTLPPSGETVHIAEFERVAHEALDQQQLQDVVRTVTTIHDHCHDVESYIRRREEPYLDTRAEIEQTLSDVRQLVDRFDGPLGERVTTLVVDGRHQSLDSVADIERRLDAADQSLHACAFDDAMRRLRQTRDAVDELLLIVDFLGGVTGTVDHGSGRIAVPADVPIDLITDLVPILEQQYDIDIEVDGETLLISDREAAQVTPKTNSPSSVTDERFDRTPSTSQSDRSANTSSAETQSSREQFAPDAVTDEILFVLREFDREKDGDIVEWQTEQLPDSVARPEVLEPLATFCRRQTDVVETITLQEGAPPGFLEIEFRDGTTVSSGLNTLRDRFADRHCT